MWKNIKYSINSPSLSNYSNIENDLVKQVVSLLKARPVNFCLRVRRQTSDAQKSGSKFSSHSVAKQPPSSYLRGIQPNQEKPRQNIDPGEWMLLTIPLATFGLGTWQVQRRKWKLGLIEDLEKRTQEPPIDFPDDLAEISSLEYRKVKVKGKFDHNEELYLGPRSLLTKGGSESQGGGVFTSGSSGRKVGGHCVITPFILSDGKRILINRGWVPSSRLKADKRPEGQIEDEVEITGVVRLQEPKGTFMPENKPHLKLFYYRDVKKMAKKCNTLPVLLDATEESTIPGGPIGGQTNIAIRNEHMSYIVTWYSLSALTAYLWSMKFVFRKL